MTKVAQLATAMTIVNDPSRLLDRTFLGWTARRWISLGALLLLTIFVLFGGLWWLLVPRVYEDQAARDELRKSFGYTMPSVFTQAAGVHPRIGAGLFLFSDRDNHFVISVSTSYSEEQKPSFNYLPDYSGEATWTSPTVETIEIRQQRIDVYKYTGTRELNDAARAWVFIFLANDGYSKVSIMGSDAWFDETVALEFIQSIQ